MPKKDTCPCCDEPKSDCSCDKNCKDCDCKKIKESYFDKFMDSILISESHKPQKQDSPIRKRIERHQERPLNRIHWK